MTINVILKNLTFHAQEFVLAFLRFCSPKRKPNLYQV